MTSEIDKYTEEFQAHCAEYFNRLATIASGREYPSVGVVAVFYGRSIDDNGDSNYAYHYYQSPHLMPHEVGGLYRQGISQIELDDLAAAQAYYAEGDDDEYDS